MAGAASTSVFSGRDPSEYDSSDPLVLFIIQLVIILVLCRILQYPLAYLRQPRVIAEVIGGVLLGPSVMARIPNFSDKIFPSESFPILTLVANLGLVFFLFLVGLELDMSLVIKNIKTASTVAFMGMAIPFGLGFAVSVGLYNQFSDEADGNVSFGIYGLFVGTAMSITAFPVLARILTELKLLSSYVGIVVLSAGVANDIVGWILLALTVALVNASSGIIVLYIFLVAFGWTAVLFVVIKPLLLYAAKKTGSLEEHSPSQLMILLIFLLIVTSAFITDIIGIHAIFGAFLAGMVMPEDKAFRAAVVDKIELIITLLFLPLYFVLSGLKTNLGLLNDGITWAYTVAIIVVGFVSKFAGASLAARYNGLHLRESMAVGSLMSCKGLVELIVLNVGLQAGILSQRVFTMFVVMALVLTFITTPLTLWIYPTSYREKMAYVHEVEMRRASADADDEHNGEPSTTASTPAPRPSVDENDLEAVPTVEKHLWRKQPLRQMKAAMRFPRYI
ncbi:Sodium/hydrogen exchanger family-domain-containing protein [Myxozyma melibiosi]|uniref:Sodium/hydrogen exchanger family-domain-containing protein n=1 Tax=Myxozyma melibiosi TaxID=54550 RepID=A0ABR1F2A2_9ASCO